MDVEAKRKLLVKTKRGLDAAIVIVEGKRDERALRETLAPTAETVKAGGRSADAVARRAIEAVEEENKEEKEDKEKRKRIVVLTDFDAEGERRAAEITEALVAEGVAPDASLRRNFARLFGVRCVEAAPTALERLEDALEKRRFERNTVKKEKNKKKKKTKNEKREAKNKREKQ
ncbi:MAG: toprim domain-containing protein [Candidatus Micrarchaeota archaeon]